MHGILPHVLAAIAAQTVMGPGFKVNLTALAAAPDFSSKTLRICGGGR